MQRTLILGGGIGGIVAATVLKRAMGKDMDVTVVDKCPYHFYTSSFPLLMIGQRKPEQITRRLDGLERKGINFVQAKVTGLHLSENSVSTTKGQHAYNYLIIALGVEYHPETVPGFAEYAYDAYDFHDLLKIRKALSQMKKGRIALFISSLPYKCPPAPYEMMFLLDQYFRQKGLRNSIQLALITPDFSPEPLAGPLVGESVRKMLSEKGIELRTEAKVLAVEESAVVLDHGGKVPADLLLGIAPHWTHNVLRNIGLTDGDGWVTADQHTLQTGYPGVYAIGDVTGIRLPVIGVLAPKAGIFAHYQAEVVARNIALLATGQNPTFRYTGKGA